ncbi:MAG TPA: gamma-glutamyl-gamma-aminobutyrate hydrolase family protein [bacterium]|nr:gamma-glutamyl-gamma-aminobutyrate hydrolase family protein [bacterium]
MTLFPRSQPVIGVLAARMRSDLDLLDKVATSYTDAIVLAGGLPIILPNISNCLERFFEMVDGFLLIGGTQDIDPSLYGQPNTASRDLDRTKDEIEMSLVRYACERNMPVLGICRGMQILNIALGGTLVQDIVSSTNHLDYPRQNEPVHTVYLSAGRVLAHGAYPINSIHHQAVATLGDGLVATGYSPDGVIESIEHERYALLGVQWHPECLPDSDLSQGIFSWLVSRASASLRP